MKDRSAGAFDILAPSSDVEVTHYQLTQSCCFEIDRRTGDFSIARSHSDTQKSEEFAHIKIDMSPGQKCITTTNSPLSISNKIWMLLIGKMAAKGMQVFQGDSLRFGQSIVKIVRLQSQIDNSASSEESFQITRSNNKNGLQITKRPSTAEFCRLCNEGDSFETPLIYNVCQCVREPPVHVDCFVDWLRKRVVRRFNANAMKVDFAKMKCDKCSGPYSNEYILHGLKLRVFDIEKPIKNPHVILAVAAPNSEEVAGFYVYEFDKKFNNATLRIGSDLEREVQLLDYTVGHLQANLLWNDGRLFLVDENSRTGSAKKMDDLVRFEELEKKKLLVDKLMFTAHMTSATKLCGCVKGGKAAEVDPFLTLPLTPAPPMMSQSKVPSNGLQPAPHTHAMPRASPPVQTSQIHSQTAISQPAPLPPSNRFVAENFHKPIDQGLLSVYSEVERKPNLIKMAFAEDNIKPPNVFPTQNDLEVSDVVRGFKVAEPSLSNMPVARRNQQPLPEIPETITPIPSGKLDNSMNEWREFNLIGSYSKVPNPSFKTTSNTPIFHPGVITTQPGVPAHANFSKQRGESTFSQQRPNSPPRAYNFN